MVTTHKSHWDIPKTMDDLVSKAFELLSHRKIGIQKYKTMKNTR